MKIEKNIRVLFHRSTEFWAGHKSSSLRSLADDDSSVVRVNLVRY